MKEQDLEFNIRKYPVKDREMVAWVQTVIGVYEGHIDGVVFPDAIGSQDRSTYDAKTKVTNAMKQSYGTSYLKMYDPAHWVNLSTFEDVATDDISSLSQITRSRADTRPVYINGLQIVGFALREIMLPPTVFDREKKYLELATKFNKDKKNFSDADLATLQEVDAKLEDYFSKGI